MSNKETFVNVLTSEYEILFQLPEYQMAAKRYTPEQMAVKFTNGLLDGSSSNDGQGVKNTCKKLKIKTTYKAIKEYLTS